ncbi:MAG: C25 family cysteine peptidase, partial [Myxococcota bacterium]
MSLFVIATLLAASPRVVLTSETAGVLTVSYQDLRKAGLRGTGFLHLERNGQPIHFWTERSGWSSGNTAYYISRGKEGLSWLEKEVSSADHVVATLRPTASARRHGLESKKPGSCEPDPILRSTRTYEYDQIREHMPHQLPESRESWFWKRVDAASPPAILNIALPGLVRSHQELTRVRIRVDSPSRLAPELSSRLSDHRVRIAVNGKVVGYREWSDSGREHWLDLELRSSLLAEDTQLEILVPPRRDPRAPKRNLVDVVFVGAVEVRYPREGRLRWADRIHVDERGAECVNLEQETLLLQRFGAGARLSPGLHRLQSPDGDWTFWTAHLDEVDKPHLRRLRMPPPSGDTEYWMIASDTYHNALLPLIEFHQKRGLKVARVSPETLFDHYTDGKPTADAIRRFVEDTE